RAKVREDLEGSAKKRIESDFRNNLLKALVEANPVDVPPSMLAEQKQILIDDLRNRMISEGLTETEFQSYLQKWEKEFEATASQMIQAGILVDTIDKKHSRESSPADCERRLETYVKHTGIDIDRIRKSYSRPDQAKKLESMIPEEKVIEYLLK